MAPSPPPPYWKSSFKYVSLISATVRGHSLTKFGGQKVNGSQGIRPSFLSYARRLGTETWDMMGTGTLMAMAEAEAEETAKGISLIPAFVGFRRPCLKLRNAAQNVSNVRK
jgi:hypothetical protein